MQHSAGRSKVARAVKSSRQSPDRAGEKRVQTKHLKFHHSVYVVLLDNAVAKSTSRFYASIQSVIE
jgi:hypothetical protein